MRMKKQIIFLDGDLLQELLESAKLIHPREVVYLLRGEILDKAERRELNVRDYLIPPLPIHGLTLASFRLSMLPPDPSIIGTIHSHPNGSLTPSQADLNNFLGKFVAIMAYPYDSTENLIAYDIKGERVRIIVT